ncbi:glycosyltransferase family 4 protein [Sulfurimonas sp.]
MSKKLLLIGSNSIHIYNYLELIDGYFDEILLLSNQKNSEYDVRTIEIDFHLSVNIPFSVSKIKKIIKDFQPSIIHIHQANSYTFLTAFALQNSQIPTVLTAWGSDILKSPKENFFYKKMLEYSLKKIDVLTSDSLNMANEILLYDKNADVKIANFGIDISDGSTQKEKLIYSNRLHNPLYNIDKIIYAFRDFLKTDKEWRLVLGATGSQTDVLKKLVKELNLQENVEFIGWVDAKINNAMYEKAQIYISIPSSDGTSISLLEALSHNCICFVSNLPANCEHILDGVNGFIEPNLNQIALDKFKTIDINLMQNVNAMRKHNYSKETNRKIFLKIYDDLLLENEK